MSLQAPARLTEAVKRITALDPRSLAVFRVMLGLLVAADAVERLPEAAALLSDEGMLPRAEVPRLGSAVNLMQLSGSVGFARLMLIGQALAGLAMAAGWFTRWAILLAWVLSVSVQMRNPLTLYGADLLLQGLLVWAWFLPVSAAASMDRRAGRAVGGPVSSVASLGYLLQVVLVYLVTWALKTGEAWQDGTAGWYVLQADQFTGPLGKVALEYPTILEWGTHATMVLELWGPLLLFVPFATERLRILVIAAMCAFHLSLGAMLSIGWWPLVSIACWMPLVPPQVWSWVGWQAGPPSVTPWGERGRQAVAAALLLVVVAVNVSAVNPAYRLPRRAWVAMRALRLDQNWNMYAPTPMRDDGWMVVQVVMKDGRKVDLLRQGRKVSWSKPENVSRHYGGIRWQRVMRSLWERPYRHVREPYLRWACEEARAFGDPDVVTMFYMREETPEFPAVAGEVKRVRVGWRECGVGP